MTAEQMLKKLGFTKIENRYFIRYRNKSKESGFAFMKMEKSAIMSKKGIYSDEIKSFVKQCKELGWLDD